MSAFTVETRLSTRYAKPIMEYIKDYVCEYGIMQRYVWRKIVQSKGDYDKAKLNTEIQNKFSIVKRTANSLISDMQGRYNALKELKEVEKEQLEYKIRHYEEQAAKITIELNALKLKAAKNELDDKALAIYRNTKRKLYFKHQRIQKFKDRLSQLIKDIESGNYKLGFGGKDMFDKQYRFAENGYKSHEAWRNDYRRRRDSGVFYLGSKDETLGNQMLQGHFTDNGMLALKLRKADKYDKKGKKLSDKDKYVYGCVDVKYMVPDLQKALDLQAVSYRFKIRGKKMYLQIMFDVERYAEPVTTLKYGAIGLDFNRGHIDMAETDQHGNLIQLKVYPLEFHGTGNKAKNEMRETIAKIGEYAALVGKTIVKEDLSFIKKKAKTAKNENKGYNRMIHTLDYARFEECLDSLYPKIGVQVIKVNPAYTSQIAKTKYCPDRKIPVHSGAAYVIARRGQGFKDRLKKATKRRNTKKKAATKKRAA